MQNLAMKHILGAALLLASSSLFAAAADQVQVEEAYVRAVPPGSANSAAFMKLTNTDSSVHSLTGAQSPATKVMELHTHTEENGMMRMRRVEKIELPVGEQVALQPGGLHLMLIGLTGDLKESHEIEVNLTFEDGSSLPLSLPVKRVGKESMDHSKHQHH
jgi:copper(I)-binding protein